MKNQRIKDIQARLKKGFDQTQYMSRTFGVELEFVYNGTKSQYELAEFLAEETQEHVVTRSYHDHSTNPRNNHRTWVLTTDGSLRHRNGWELVTPILDEDTDGLLRLQNMLDALDKFGDCKVTRNAGTHIHFGVQSTDFYTLGRFLQLYAMYEPAIDLIMPQSRRGNVNREWARSFGNTSVVAKQNTIKSLKKATDKRFYRHDYNGALNPHNRYMKINLTSIRKHNTVEIRHHSGTLNFDKISTFMKLVDFLFRWAEIPMVKIPVPKHNDPEKLWLTLVDKLQVAKEIELLNKLEARKEELNG